MRVLLMGNPNVGKSALFYHLTGVAVKTSNYAGTTVTFTEGKWRLPPENCGHDCAQCPGCAKAAKNAADRKEVDLIDVPGTYTLDSEIKSEKIAADMLATGDVIINVVDATNLERNLVLTMQLCELKKPMIMLLNMWDETQHMGIGVDYAELESILGIPVVPTNGRTGMGCLDAGRRLKEAAVPRCPGEGDIYSRIGKIVSRVQNLSHRHHTVRERLQDISMHPVWGLPIALAVLAGMFELVIQVGGFLSAQMARLFEIAWLPLMNRLYEVLGPEWLKFILIGRLYDGQIGLETSMGVLTTGIFVPIGLVMPYLLFFYLALGFLEDWGYLPRMAVLFDRFFHKIGLHGYSVIPIMLSTGCNIPGVLALRNLESRRERFITAAITCTTIPCMAQSAVIFSEAGKHGAVYIWLIVSTLLSFAILLGILLDRITKGQTPSLISEMPPYRIPGPVMQFKKLMTRLKGFFTEAVPLMMLGILLVQVLDLSGVLKHLFGLMKPVVSGLWGLPKEAASAMLVGVIRKDAAVALLEPLNLTAMQSATAIVALVLYFPCIATYTVLAREVGTRDLLAITAIMAATALLGGLFINLMGSILPPALIIGAEAAVVLTALAFSGKMKKRA